ncbi:MAG: hypothetical protein K8Q89_10325 [Nitrosarchaeum sp.]|nr:hypothetical protein [Nitrosarchaeum sp.]
MKTRPLIIIGIIAIIGISLSLIVSINYEQFTNRNTIGGFNYKDTEPITQDTYLNKTISEWQKESFDSLMSYHGIYGDIFFEKLGALVMKNEMLNELNKQNIQVNNPDFKVHSGMVLTSLPPHVSFEAFVNDTNNNTYRLSGMTNQAKVEGVHITKLEFFDTSVRLPLESVLSQNKTITIRAQNGNEPQVVPYNLIVHGNHDIVVEFQNTLSVPIRIQGDGDWQNPNWYGPTILPLTTASMTFQKSGVYAWHSRTLPLPGSTSSDHMGGGQISIIPDDMSNLSFQDRQTIGAAILQNSEIPWSGMGSGNDKGITIDFNSAMFDAMPNAKEYYQARAKQLIPFDVPIIIEEPYQKDD